MEVEHIAYVSHPPPPPPPPLSPCFLPSQQYVQGATGKRTSFRADEG